MKIHVFGGLVLLMVISILSGVFVPKEWVVINLWLGLIFGLLTLVDDVLDVFCSMLVELAAGVYCTLSGVCKNWAHHGVSMRVTD